MGGHWGEWMQKPQTSCNYKCQVSYTNRICGGADGHYQLYADYDFEDFGTGGGAYDPWNSIYYQVAGIKRYWALDQSGLNDLKLQYFLHATDNRGVPVYQNMR